MGLDSYTSTCNSIINFYAKSGMTASALALFDAMADKDSVSWNSVIHGFLIDGHSEFGLGLFNQARGFSFDPNVATLLLTLQACWRLGAHCEGLILHGFVIKIGFFDVGSIQNALLSMYAKSHDLVSAQMLFDVMPVKDVISWSTLIAGYAQSAEAWHALRLFREMIAEGLVEVDELAGVSVLQACSINGEGGLIHAHLIRRGLEAGLFVGNSLVDMYSKCLDLDSVSMAFKQISRPNTVSWNCLLSGLVLNGKYSSEQTQCCHIAPYSSGLLQAEDDPIHTTKEKFIKAICELYNSYPLSDE